MALYLCLLLIYIGRVSATNNTNITSSANFRGWVDSPNTRGTLDIVWACLFTTSLCTWTALRLNIPAPTDKQLLRQIRWVFQAFLAPEYLVFLATIQKIEARRSIREWEEVGCSFWTLRYGLFANMGGFRLRPSDHPAFPINSKQLLYLVKHSYLSPPMITSANIINKEAPESFQNFLNFVQLVWFILQCSGRAIQHLPTTTLELATIGLIVCTFVTNYQWRFKPRGYQEPVEIKMEKGIGEVLIQAGHLARHPYTRTPLDFVDEHFPSWLTRIEPHLRWKIFSPPERPIPRFTNERLPTIVDDSQDSIILVIVVMIYSCIHFVAWDFNFPTAAERMLWRVNCIIMVSTATIFFASEFYHLRLRYRAWRRWKMKLFPGRAIPLSLLPPHPEEVEFSPTWQVVIMLVVTLLYTLARTYIAIECLVSLRSLPAHAFDTVNWSKYIPHF